MMLLATTVRRNLRLASARRSGYSADHPLPLCVTASDLAMSLERLVGITPKRHDPGIDKPLQAVGDARVKWAVHAPGRHHGMHDASIDLLQHVKPEPEPLQNTRAEIVYNDVGRSHHLL